MSGKLYRNTKSVDGLLYKRGYILLIQVYGMKIGVYKLVDVL